MPSKENRTLINRSNKKSRGGAISMDIPPGMAAVQDKAVVAIEGHLLISGSRLLGFLLSPFTGHPKLRPLVVSRGRWEKFSILVDYFSSVRALTFAKSRRAYPLGRWSDFLSFPQLRKRSADHMNLIGGKRLVLLSTNLFGWGGKDVPGPARGNSDTYLGMVPTLHGN